MNQKNNNEFNVIDLIYTPTAKVNRYKGTQGKSILPCHMVDREWKLDIRNVKNWLPYHNQDINFCRDQIALIHEGEKACNYGRSCGLVSFAFCGAKSQNEDFLKQQLL